MATKEFLLQGITDRTHGAAVRGMFDVDDVQSVVISVAFLNEGGVEYIEEMIRPHARITRVFAGIRNEITSFQGLERLRLLICNGLYTVDTGSRTVIFHPKFFFVRGSDRAKMIVGSANLTLGGLNNNIEASLVLELDLGKERDRVFVENVESQIAKMTVDYPENITAIEEVGVLRRMLAGGCLVNENSLPPPRPQTSVKDGGVEDTTPIIELKVPRIWRSSRKESDPTSDSSEYSPQIERKSISNNADPATPSVTLKHRDLVWQSKPLTARSLNIKTGNNTNPTGSTTLGKGQMPAINPTTYFRNDIFGHLTWVVYTNRAGNNAEMANADFQIAIKGSPVGIFALTLRHSSTRIAAAPHDKNLPTELSWNQAKVEISKPDLIGCTMKIYRTDNIYIFYIDIS